MFRFVNVLVLATSLLVVVSCSTEPQPIEYNIDQCAECKMMIADQRFGAELVTSKGKVYKYDAAECMIAAYVKQEEAEYAHVLVTDFTNPSNLMDAKLAIFLISKDRQSPMGANLSAYASTDKIEDNLRSGQAKVLKWEQVLDNFKQ